jgi:hypothetical protein
MSNATMPYQQHGPHDGHAGDHGSAPATSSPGPQAAGGAPGSAMQQHPMPGHDDHGHPGAMHAGMSRGQGPAHHGRDKIDWGPDVWKRIDAAVKDEIARSRVAAKFLPPVHVAAKATTVPADIINQQMTEEKTAVNALSVDETATTRVNEYWVEFSLTPAQVEEEAAAAHGAHAAPHAPAHAQTPAHGQAHPGHHPHHGHAAHHGHGHASTGVSLATRAANFLAQVEDSIIFQGQNALQSFLLGGSATPVNFRVTANTLDLGLLNLLLPGGTFPALLGTAFPPDQVVLVSPAQTSGAQAGLYQEKTVAAVAQAFSILQSKGQYGPYALVLHTAPFADAHSPLPTTLITPAEPIRHLMSAGFFGTGTLPPFLAASGATGGGLNGGLGTGSITTIKVTAGGTGYTSPPTVAIAAPTGTGGGTTATATANVLGGVVTSITITNGGTNYVASPSVTLTGGAGSGAQAVVPQLLYTGIVVSLGGNTMDLVRGKMSHDEDVIVRFEQKDVDGNYRFRVVERFALRLKDITAVVQLQFLSV